jgi:flagellar protein FlbD
MRRAAQKPPLHGCLKGTGGLNFFKKLPIDVPGARAPGSIRRPLGTRIMIQLTRLNNQPLAVNSDLIKFVEKAPDTVLTLVTGEKIVVKERPEEVLSKIVEFRRSILVGLPLQLSETPAASAPAVVWPEAGPEKS